MASSINIQVLLKDAASAGLKALEKSFRDVQRTIDATARAMVHAGRRMASAGVAIGAALAVPAKITASFEDIMLSVKAVTRATEEEYKRLVEAARKAGEETRYRAREAAQAQLELARAGLSSAENIAALPNVIRLAQAAGTDLGSAARFVARSLRMFSEEAEATGGTQAFLRKAIDATVYSVNNSVQDFTDYSQAVEHIGSLISTANIKFSAFSAAIALTAKAARGTKGATAIRNFLIGISQASDEAREKLNALGLTLDVIQDEAGNFRLPEILKQLKAATDKLGGAEVVRQLTGVFGRRGSGGIAALVKAAEQFEEFSRQAENATGIAKETADTMESGLGGAFRVLLSVLESLALEIGESFKVELIAFARNLSGIVRAVIVWAKENRGLVSSLALAAGKVAVFLVSTGGLLVALGSIGIAISGAMKAILAFKAAIATVGVPALSLFGAAITLYLIKDLEVAGLKIQEWAQFTVLELTRWSLKAIAIVEDVANVLSLGLIGGSDQAQLKRELDGLTKAQDDLVDRANQRKIAQTKLRLELEKTKEAAKKAAKETANAIKDIISGFARGKTSIRGVNLELEKLKTRLAEVELAARRGFAGVADVFGAKGAVLLAENLAKYKELLRKLQAAPAGPARESARKQLAAFLEQSKQAGLRFKADQEDALESVAKKQIALERLIESARIETLRDEEQRELDSLDLRYRQQIENFERQAREAELSEDQINAKKAKLADFHEAQVAKIREKYAKERDLFLGTSSCRGIYSGNWSNG